VDFVIPFRPATPPLVSLLEALLRRAQAGDELGIRCRACGFLDTVVIDSSNTQDGVRRLRRCLRCRSLRRTIELDEDATTKRSVRKFYPPRDKGLS
jgi:hypothetical protein